MVWIFSHRFINTRRNPRISWVIYCEIPFSSFPTFSRKHAYLIAVVLERCIEHQRN